jgi:hypothetical protein
MAPGYKPLEVGQPQGVPLQGILGQDFNTPAIDFTDAEKTQAALRAQALANQAQGINVQSSQIGLDELKRKLSDQQAIRDALIAQFSGGGSEQPQQDPNSPDAQYMSAMKDGGYVDPNAVDAGAQQPPTDTAGQFDPQKALKLATQVAFQHGDLDTAINTTRAANTGLIGGASNRLLTPDEVDRFKELDLPEGATLADARVALALKNSGTQSRKLDEVNSRFNQSMDYKKEVNSAPGLFDAITDSDGNPRPVDANQKKNLTGLQAGVDTVVRNGDNLIGQLQSDRFSIGDKLAIQKQEIANMYPALRTLDGQGVRFNEFIKGLDDAQFGDKPYVVDRILASMEGQDPAAAMDRFIREVVKQTQIRVNANNGAFSPNKVNDFDPELHSLFGKYGLYDRGQPKLHDIPGPGDGGDSGDSSGSSSSSGQNSGISIPKVSAGGGLPRNPDGSALSKEQFLKWKNGN